MKKSLILIFLLGIMVAACQSNQLPTKPVAREVRPTITPHQAGPSVTDEEERIVYTEEILFRLHDYARELKIPEVEELTNFLLTCSILKPVAEGGMVIKGKTDACHIMVLKNEDAKYDRFAAFFTEERGFSVFDHEARIIYLFMEHPFQVDPDYLSLVLLHEGVHAALHAGCPVGDYECRATDESMAYRVEFLFLDYLGQNNPKYYSDLRKAAEALAPEYEATGNIVFPDYSKASEMRKYFNSYSEDQDRLYLALYWLRTYWEMFVLLRGDPTSANISFEAFLAAMYRNNAIQ